MEFVIILGGIISGLAGAVIRLWFSHKNQSDHIVGVEKKMETTSKRIERKVDDNSRNDEKDREALYAKIDQMNKHHYNEIKRIDENFGKFRESFGEIKGMLQTLLGRSDLRNGPETHMKNREK